MVKHRALKTEALRERSKQLKTAGEKALLRWTSERKKPKIGPNSRLNRIYQICPVTSKIKTKTLLTVMLLPQIPIKAEATD